MIISFRHPKLKFINFRSQFNALVMFPCFIPDQIGNDCFHIFRQVFLVFIPTNLQVIHPILNLFKYKVKLVLTHGGCSTQANSKWRLAFCGLIATLRAPCRNAVAVSLVCLWWTSGDQTCHQRQGDQMTIFDLTDVFTTYLYLRGCSGNKQISLCTRL